MKALIIDFETTGPDPKSCFPIELGAMAYDLAKGKRWPCESRLIVEDTWPSELTDEITELTGITDKMLDESGVNVKAAMGWALSLVAEHEIDLMVAYNADFDREIWEWCLDSTGQFPKVRELPWLCAMNDVPYPERLMRCKKLSHRAFDLDIPMYGVQLGEKLPRITKIPLHRASADVSLVGDIFDKIGGQKILEYWREPWLVVQAVIPPPWVGRGGDGGAGRDAARGLGFSWEKTNGVEQTFEKLWVRRVKANQFDDLANKCGLSIAPFSIRVIDGA